MDVSKFPEKNHFTSKAKSSYFFTEKGVYRKSNHWGRVANCRWRLITDKKYKNQQTVVGFANWTDFYPLVETGKLFFIKINFKEKTAKLQYKKEKTTAHLLTLKESQKRIKQINHLFKNENWARHFYQDIEELRIKIITEFIRSDKSLQQIKLGLK